MLTLATISAGAAAIAAGAVMTAVGLADGMDGDAAGILGMGLVIVGVMTTEFGVVWRLLRRRSRSEEDLWNEGVEVGFNRGYVEGRRVGRPGVIHLPEYRAVKGPAGHRGHHGEHQQRP